MSKPARKVGLSRRLRSALLKLQLAQGRPKASERVLGATFDQNNFRHREWKDITRAAELAVTPKDLRDTFASQLLTAGVQLGYVSHQLGRASVATTSNHYARWCGGSEYRERISPGKGELPADLLQKLDEKWSQSGHKSKSAQSPRQYFPNNINSLSGADDRT